MTIRALCAWILSTGLAGDVREEGESFRAKARRAWNMKTRSAIVAVSAAACILAMTFPGSFATGAARDSAALDAVVQANNSFALEFYGQAAKQTGSLFFSPYSISTALAMTYAGARGETARQMASVLHLGPARDELHQALSNLMGVLNAPGKPYQLSVANALWAQIGYEFRPEYLAVTNRYYGAGLREVDYVPEDRREETRQTINKWVEAKTNDKIKELIKRGMLTEFTRLVLTNAIYFKGTWQVQFKPSATRTAPFFVSEQEKVDVPLMHQVARFRYGEPDDELQILEMPYSGGDLSMVVLLPTPGRSLAELERRLSSAALQSWLNGLRERDVEVFLPRFKLEKEFVLNQALQDLGMVDAFDENAADFSGMTFGKDLYISSVVHKAFVEVNEEGTEAAAATAVIMNGKSIALEEPPVFRADRPFVFLIRDARSGAVLFMGRLVDPRV